MLKYDERDKKTTCLSATKAVTLQLVKGLQRKQKLTPIKYKCKWRDIATTQKLTSYDNDRETCVIMQNDYQKAMSFALDDKMIGNFYYDTPSSVCVWMVPYRKSPQKHSNPKLFHNFAKTIKTQRI